MPQKQRLIQLTAGKPVSYKIKSMTAFARTQTELEQATFTWELRSVNHRYLEPGFKLPERFRQLEMALREKLRARLARGKIDIHLQFANKEQEQLLVVNTSRVQELVKALDQVKAIGDISGQTSAMQILNWPGVLEQQEEDTEVIHKALLSAFSEAIDQLIESRKAEGIKLAQMVAERTVQIRELVDQIEALVPKILQSQQERLQTRLAELDLDIDAERAAQEAAIFAQKMDVAEEIDRLRAHLEEIEKALSSTKPCGRRLDFLMQELNREANTLGSKSVHVDTSQGAVELKVLIEQIREQVQNIE